MKIYSIHKSSRNTIRGFQSRKATVKKFAHKDAGMLNLREIFDKINENPFIFQIIGLSVLTLAILISFQSLADFSVTPVSASTYEVRMLTNFKSNSGKNVSELNKIEEIQLNKFEKIEVQKTENLYTVKSGDTLTSISKESNTGIADLLEINSLDETSQLKIGQLIKLSK
jgi:hypothetical protein